MRKRGPIFTVLVIVTQAERLQPLPAPRRMLAPLCRPQDGPLGERQRCDADCSDRHCGQCRCELCTEVCSRPPPPSPQWCHPTDGHDMKILACEQWCSSSRAQSHCSRCVCCWIYRPPELVRARHRCSTGAPAITLYSANPGILRCDRDPPKLCRHVPTAAFVAAPSTQHRELRYHQDSQLPRHYPHQHPRRSHPLH